MAIIVGFEPAEESSILSGPKWRFIMLTGLDTFVTATIPFEIALGYLKSGWTISRSGWNGKGMWLGLRKPDQHSEMELPYIYMNTADGKLVPWVASQTDLLSEDWILHSNG